MNIHKKICLGFGAACMAASAFAQSYVITSSTIDGGGGTSTGGVYSVSGTIGQPDAGKMSGGNYSLDGGFWGIIAAVQTPEAPLLTISYFNNQAVVSWSPAVSGWTLQTNNNVATPTWGNYLGPILNNSVTNLISPGNLFFRLKQ